MNNHAKSVRAKPFRAKLTQAVSTQAASTRANSTRAAFARAKSTQAASLIFSVILSCVGLLGTASVHAVWLDETQSIMGTQVRVRLWHEDSSKAQSAIGAVMAEMHRIDATLSPYIDTSELALVNLKAAKSPQVISAELAFLIEKSLFYSRVSHGAFDITYASVGHHYDYRKKQAPSDSVRDELLPAINYRWLELGLGLDKKSSTLKFAHSNVKIDLGGIAKGYAVDRSIAILQKFGVENASVSAGGDSRLLGDRRGREWMVGIKNPRAEGTQSVMRLPLANVAVSTSGDYERYFIDEQGDRVHHIINPRTGKSASGLVSVTVLGDQGVDTDPLSTTVFVLGVEKGLALLDQLSGVDAILIDNKGKVHYSSGLVEPE
ncbi:MAG: thiamine biosynthesis lipoprotein [Flavobacteriales bacterium]|jgi:thiamine biosynthesis lipoprotein